MRQHTYVLTHRQGRNLAFPVGLAITVNAIDILAAEDSSRAFNVFLML